MQKKLLTAAIGAAFVAGTSLAQAAVTVGGHAQVEYYNANNECSTTGAGVGSYTGSATCAAGTARTDRATGLIDNARGRFWIAADEDITGSLKALAKFEFSVDTANSGQAATSGNSATGSGAQVGYDTTPRGFDTRTREKYVGLQGGFGTLTLGNLHGVYKRMGGVRWDAFNATVLEARGNGGQSGGDLSGVGYSHNGFIPGAIKWETDKLLGPVRLEVLLAPDSGSFSGVVGDTGNGYDYQIGVSIKPIKPLEIMLAHSNNKATNISGVLDDAKATKVGVRGVFGGTSAFVQYEMADMNGPTGAAPGIGGLTVPGAIDAKWLLLGFGQKFGGNEIVVQVGRHDRDARGVSTTTLGTEAFYYAAGYIYNFSKTAKVWAGVRKTDAERGLADREVTVYSAGMRKDF